MPSCCWPPSSCGSAWKCREPSSSTRPPSLPRSSAPRTVIASSTVFWMRRHGTCARTSRAENRSPDCQSSIREFDLIELLHKRFRPHRTDTILVIGDDCALLAPPTGHELAVTTDTLVSGRHFPVDTPAADIGYKAVAVNISDLGAMGATPAW